MITGFNHLTLCVKDLDIAFNFYKDVMGFKPLCRWKEGCYFLAGDLWICLFNDPEQTPAGSYTHYAFSVEADDFPKFVKHLDDKGVVPTKDNESEGDSIYFRDPDGHQLEVHVGDWKSRIAHKNTHPWPGAEFFV